MDLDYKYMSNKELENTITSKREELYKIDMMSSYPFGTGRYDLALSLKAMRLRQELIVMQEALIYRQNQLLKGSYFPYNKK